MAISHEYMTLSAHYFTVSGRVQGVGYRVFTLRNAQSLGLAGWVRNCDDGTVEGEVYGPSETLEKFWVILRDGPPFARVTALHTRPSKAVCKTLFEIRR